MDNLETLQRIGYSSPSQSWIQINKKIKIDDLATLKKKQRIFYEPDDDMVILSSRWMEHRSKGGGRSKNEDLFSKIEAEIPSILHPHVQLNKEGYGFLVHWEVAATFEKKNNRGLVAPVQDRMEPAQSAHQGYEEDYELVEATKSSDPQMTILKRLGVWTKYMPH